MKFIMVVLLGLSLCACGPSENVNKEATTSNAVKACTKYGMSVSKISWVFENRSDVECVDPSTKELKKIQILNIKWNPKK